MDRFQNRDYQYFPGPNHYYPQKQCLHFEDFITSHFFREKENQSLLEKQKQFKLPQRTLKPENRQKKQIKPPKCQSFWIQQNHQQIQDSPEELKSPFLNNEKTNVKNSWKQNYPNKKIQKNRHYFESMQDIAISDLIPAQQMHLFPVQKPKQLETQGKLQKIQFKKDTQNQELQNLYEVPPVGYYDFSIKKKQMGHEHVFRQNKLKKDEIDTRPFYNKNIPKQPKFHFGVEKRFKSQIAPSKKEEEEEQVPQEVFDDCNDIQNKLKKILVKQYNLQQRSHFGSSQQRFVYKNELDESPGPGYYNIKHKKKKLRVKKIKIFVDQESKVKEETEQIIENKHIVPELVRKPIVQQKQKYESVFKKKNEACTLDLFNKKKQITQEQFYNIAQDLNKKTFNIQHSQFSKSESMHNKLQYLSTNEEVGPGSYDIQVTNKRLH